MYSMIKQLFQSKTPIVKRPPPAHANNESSKAAIPENNTQEAASILSQEALDFLLPLQKTCDLLLDINLLPLKDRSFITSNIRKIRDNNFEIPMLPHVVIRTQQLLSKPDVEASDLLDVIKGDPTMSAELLRLANSSYLGFTYPTLDLKQAITRIGFNQFHGLIVLLSLRSHILQNGFFNNEIKWTLELSLSLAKLCQKLAPELEMPPDEAFTLGLLHNIDYLVIIGEASLYSEKSTSGVVSREAIIETICRLGSDVHNLVTRSWGMGDSKWIKLAVNSEGLRSFESSDAEKLLLRFDSLQNQLINALGGRTFITDTVGFDARSLKDALNEVTAPSKNNTE